MPLVKPKANLAQDKFTVDVKVRLTLLRMTVTKLALELGLSRTAVSQAINNNIHQPTRRAIAQRLKLPLPK